MTIDPFRFPDEDPDVGARKAATKRALAEYEKKVARERKAPPATTPGKGDTIEAKAVRLLADGPGVGDLGDAGCGHRRGSGRHRTHEVRWGDLDGWWCDCPGSTFHKTCSHVAAVRRVVALTTRTEAPTPMVESPF